VTAALVVVPLGTEPALLSRPVGGVPLLLRALLSLRRRGFRSLQVAGLEGPLPEDRRLGGMEIAAADEPRDRPQLVVPATLVWDERLLRRILDGRTVHRALAICPDGARAREQARIFSQGGAADDLPPGTVLVRSAADLEAAERFLVRSAGKDTDGIVSRHINRKVSQALTGLLVNVPLTPNAVTLVVSLVGVAAAALVLAGGYARTALGAALFVLNSVLDGVDGELARLRFQESATGAWLDRLSDKLVMVLFFGAVFVRLMRGDPSPGLRAAAVLSVAGFAAGLPLVYLYGHLLRRRGGGSLRVPDRGLRRAFDLVAFEVVFGGVLFRAGGTGGGGSLHRALSKFSLLLKNDVLAMVYLALALAGRLPDIFWPLAPIGGALLVLAACALLALGADSLRGPHRQ
jgi:CDP-L-myo-inositol myo-inositolphosphotransferase